MSLSRGIIRAIKRTSLSARFISQAETQQGPSTATVYEDAAPFSSIPVHPLYKLLYSTYKNPELKLQGHIMMKNLMEEHGDIFRIRLPGLSIVMLADPEDIKTLLYNDEKNPIEPGFDFFVAYRQRIRKDLYPDTPGLLGAHGDKWYEVRSKVQQDMLRPKSAMYYIDDITEVSAELAALIEMKMDGENEIKDIVPFIYRWALDAVGAIFLDTRIGCLKEPIPPVAKDMIKHVEVVLGQDLQELLQGFPLWKLYRTKHLDAFDKSSEAMYHIMAGIISDAKQNSRKTKKSSKDEMSVMEKLIEKCGESSKIPEVMAMDALLAGIDTTGNTSAFLFYHLGSHPDKQDILYQEIKEKLGDSKLTPAILNELKYLKAVQHESQRLLPAIGGVSRLTQKDMVLKGYQIPKNTMVGMQMVPIMRSEKHFKNADQFIPERWMRGCPQKHDAHPFAFIPFGHGARMCIGRRFAELEVQILVIETIRRFKLVYEGEPIDIITPFVNRPDKPIALKFIKR